MEIVAEFTRKDPEDRYGISPVVTRYLLISTKMRRDVAIEITNVVDPSIVETAISIEKDSVAKKTTFKFDIVTPVPNFQKFLYEMINNESNSSRWY